MTTRLKNFLRYSKPERLIVLGYSLIILLGFLLLCLPICHKQPVAALDNLFIATSALSTTGLATVSVADNYNFLGELVILLLIQLGGIGYMSIGSFIILGRKKRLSETGVRLIQFDFSLPDKYPVLHFVKDVIIFSIVIEVLGALGLYFIFLENGVDNALWSAIFHSISAFCTAGFSLFNNSFEGYYDNFYLNAVISALSFAGAVGFIVFSDYYEYLLKPGKKITYTSKIILRFTLIVFVVAGMILLVSDEGLHGYPTEDKILLAFFQSMTALTTVGFNSYPIGNLLPSSLFLLTIVMFFGASPSGTGGGLKSTTITALYAQMMATLKGKREVTFLHRIIPNHRVRLAASNFFFYSTVLTLGILALLLTEKPDAFSLLFEATSALGTVGISTGITGELSVLGKLIIVALMFFGRIGPLSLGVAIMANKEEEKEEIVEEDLAI
ncbi:potassium transporter TrkG [Rapidithrix thailandica]|uniref:Potassium transporter TrkG n=1 Tax=Rapidithrix thailandica TaxID=413964 RepID=A0AAW9SF06_9BACT